MPPRPRSHDATSGAGLNAPPARSPAAPRPARPSPPRRARGPRRGHGLRLPPLLCQDGCRGGGGEGRRWCEARAFPMITGPHSLGPCSDCRLVYANRPAIAGVAPTPAASRHPLRAGYPAIARWSTPANGGARAARSLTRPFSLPFHGFARHRLQSGAPVVVEGVYVGGPSATAVMKVPGPTRLPRPATQGARIARAPRDHRPCAPTRPCQ